jgi:hypothetical protein
MTPIDSLSDNPASNPLTVACGKDQPRFIDCKGFRHGCIHNPINNFGAALWLY